MSNGGYQQDQYDHLVTIIPWFDSVMMQHNMQHLKKLEVGVVAALTYELGHCFTTESQTIQSGGGSEEIDWSPDGQFVALVNQW